MLLVCATNWHSLRTAVRPIDMQLQIVAGSFVAVAEFSSAPLFQFSHCSESMDEGSQKSFFQRRNRNGQEVHEKSAQYHWSPGKCKSEPMWYHLIPVRRVIVKKTGLLINKRVGRNFGGDG